MAQDRVKVRGVRETSVRTESMRLQTALALSGGQHDQTQVSLLDEVCLLVDPHDKPVGLMKKGECTHT